MLKDIPVVNLLFGSTDSGEEESELVVLVRVDLHHPGDSPVRVMRATPAHIPQPSQWQQDTETLPYGTGRVKSP